MKKSDIYEIAIKVLGLYLLFTCIDLLTAALATSALLIHAKQNPEMFESFGQTPFLILSIANLVFVVLFALFLTLKTKTIVKFVCKPSDYEERSMLSVDRELIYEIALVLMGLILVVWTLPDFAIKLKEHITLVQSDVPTNEYDTNFVITAAIKIALGITAVIYSKSLAVGLGKVNGDSSRITGVE
ncbi:hypothetical protein M8998_14010 [Sphingobacterium sp. lm-10]|uniref:hypothetical protein n=1 Tax=Sphingobacterium sp. lm-10 TaxID=2944904 RepID=UPI00202134CC|nr:hypothetical protein [Sphingobacterium sp. lm-10]MCL7989059.1 hypothetical protein [Sphingobacterium sp. lm-10]